MKLNFDPYREQVQSEVMSPEAAKRIRKQLEVECSRIQMADVDAKRSRPLRQIGHRTKLHLVPLAVCMAFLLGVGVLTTLASPILFRTAEEATAYPPLFPSVRIEIDRSYGTVTDNGGVYTFLEAHIVDPALQGKDCTLELVGNESASLYDITTDFDLLNFERSWPRQSVSFSPKQNVSFYYIERDPPLLDDCVNFPPDSLDGTKPDHTLQRTVSTMRNARFVVTTGDHRITYTVDFTGFDGHSSIDRHLRRTLPGLPVMLELNKEVEPL